MVVNMKLGCINHALLTAEVIRKDGLTIAGWVANFAEDMDCYTENVQTLTRYLPMPLLGEIIRYQCTEDSLLTFDNILLKLIGRVN